MERCRTCGRFNVAQKWSQCADCERLTTPIEMRGAADKAQAGENPGGKRVADQPRRKCKACFGKGGGYRPGETQYEKCTECNGKGWV